MLYPTKVLSVFLKVQVQNENENQNQWLDFVYESFSSPVWVELPFHYLVVVIIGQCFNCFSFKNQKVGGRFPQGERGSEERGDRGKFDRRLGFAWVV